MMKKGWAMFHYCWMLHSHDVSIFLSAHTIVPFHEAKHMFVTTPLNDTTIDQFQHYRTTHLDLINKCESFFFIHHIAGVVKLVLLTKCNMISSFISTQDTKYSADVTWFDSIIHTICFVKMILTKNRSCSASFCILLERWRMTKYRRRQHMVDTQIEGHRIFYAEWND